MSDPQGILKKSPYNKNGNKRVTFTDKEPPIDYDLKSSDDGLTKHADVFPNYLADVTTQQQYDDGNLSDENHERINAYLDDQHKTRILPVMKQNPEPVPDYPQEEEITIPEPDYPQEDNSQTKSFADQIKEQSKKLQSAKPNNDISLQNSENKGDNWQQKLASKAAERLKGGLNKTGHNLW